jgi:uncharacterized protein YbaR (Trm112 family)
MTRDLIDLLCCPPCRGQLTLHATDSAGAHVEEGELACAGCGHRYPIRGGIPRFVPRDNYSSSFGFQWNRFRRTQLDSHTGHPISRDRFFRQSGWLPEEMRGRLVLDVGCGAGRFSEVALSTGARLVSLDYSEAVDACRANLGAHDRLNVIQGDVYNLPFRPGVFDFVYCFGVLQHTPDVARAFASLRPPLRRGGRLAVDLYPQLAGNVLWPKYWLRPLTRRVPPERLFPIVERMVKVLWPLSLGVGRVPVIGRKLRYAIPVVNYEGRLPLSPVQLREWAVLDTFDMLSPKYDQPQRAETLRAWFEQAGFESIEAFRSGLVVGRGRVPLANLSS